MPSQNRGSAVCPLCNEIIIGKHHLKRHIERRHSESDGPTSAKRPKLTSSIRLHGHFVNIDDKQKLMHKLQCDECGKFFKTLKHLNQHQAGHCKKGESEYCYSGGCYEAKQTIFDKLLEFGIVVETARRFCPSFVTWDCEAILEALELKYRQYDQDANVKQRLEAQNIQVELVDGPAPGQQRRERHKVVTGALKSTVAGATDTLFFYNKEPDVLVMDMHNAMLEISAKNYEIEKEKYAKEFQRLEELYRETKAIIDAASDEQDVRREKATLHKLQVLHNWLDRYCRQLTVLTYNGSCYDLNLVKQYLFPKLVKEVRNARQERQEGELQWPKVISRGTAILCLSTKELKFLDVRMYMAAGTSLDQFIKAFNPNGEQKACYPYELIRRYEDLEAITEFPPKSAFYSTLKNKHITDKQYEEAKEIWNSLPVKNMLEYTKVYNSRDVEPFLEGCINMAETYWRDFGVDIFKEALSIPGVCLVYLFRKLHQLQPSTRFGLFNDEEGKLCQELYSNKSLCGGLSFIGQRIAVKDETPIRGNPNKVVKKVVGYDFNALYLYSIMQDMPTGKPDHWKMNEETGYLEKNAQDNLKKRKCYSEVEYLKFRAWLDNVYIHHAEHGEQTSLGIHGYRVDGFAKDAQPKPRVFNYNGCYYHYHNDGCLNPKLKLDDAKKDMLEKDATKNKHLVEMGFDVDTVWECQWNAVKRVAGYLRRGQVVFPYLSKFIPVAAKYNEYLQCHPPRAFSTQPQVKEVDMIDAIMTSKVFGFAKVDIETIEAKKELFEDFPPIIKHATIGREHIGPYMTGIAEKYDLLKKPRDCLIGSYFGEQIWLMTPLLQFYQRHGVVVKKLYEVVQYDREKAFEWFGNTVTEKRIEGDKNKAAMGTLADVYKTIGNSSYGKTITNLKKHKEVMFTDSQELERLHNDPYHHKSDPITDDCFQVCMNKKNVQFGLPMIIGLSVYAYAKLRMLEFIYDILLVYISKEDFMFLESDTDSIYLALSAGSLEELVVPEKRAEFEQVKHLWFVQDQSQKRTPGLLKVEKEADKFIGLCSKCYICDDNNAKAKGVQLRNESILTFDNYRKVLFDLPGADWTAFNMGIRCLPDGIHTVVQRRQGLTPLYIKRICMPDGTTMPLHL